jgi:hypothetical protein
MCSEEPNVIQCRTLSQHPQYTVHVHSLHSTARCFQSVCNSVTPWCDILFPTNSSPLVHPPVHIPPAPHQSRQPAWGLSREMRTVPWHDFLLSVCPCSPTTRHTTTRQQSDSRNITVAGHHTSSYLVPQLARFILRPYLSNCVREASEMITDT